MLDLSVRAELLALIVFSEGCGCNAAVDLAWVTCLPRMKCVEVVWIASCFLRLVGVKYPRFGPPSLAIIREIATSIP